MVDIKGLQKLTCSMKILYVEDDLEVQNNTKMIFEELFSSVTTADDGREGFELYKKEHFDIVITDINMPNMNGIELIQEIKKINITQIVIIISAHNETEYFIDGIQSGIDGYILKPISYEQLFQTLQKVATILAQRKENIEYKSYIEKLVEEKTQDLEKNYIKMHQMLTMDKVTGLPNTNMLYQYLDLHESKEISICIAKVDNYTFLNQSYMQDVCTILMRNSAEFLQLNLPQDFTLYRYAEDEFIIVGESGEKDFFLQMVIQINALFKETPVARSEDGKDIYITFSCAIVCKEPNKNILQKARATLNELSRLNMAGRYSVYEPDAYYVKELQTENQWFQKIREIIENDKLIPYFHPIVSNETNEIKKYECLVRAEDDGTTITPIDFLEAAKKAGLIGNLSKIMINKCFKFFSNTDIHFSINITNEDLLDEKFADFVISKQIQYELDTKQVMFEILEDIIFDGNHKAPIENLNKLKAQGFLLALDDFGSDRSNLSRLVSILNLDYIKIDGQFIKDIDTNPTHYKIVESIVTLSKQLGIQLVAEYVSTQKEYEAVKKLGIGFSQGYYFFKPEKNIY